MPWTMEAEIRVIGTPQRASQLTVPSFFPCSKNSSLTCPNGQRGAAKLSPSLQKSSLPYTSAPSPTAHSPSNHAFSMQSALLSKPALAVANIVEVHLLIQTTHFPKSPNLTTREHSQVIHSASSPTISLSLTQQGTSSHYPLHLRRQHMSESVSNLTRAGQVTSSTALS